MKTISSVNGRVIYGNCEPDDTLLEISSYTHYTIDELCGIIDEIVEDGEKEPKQGHWIVEIWNNREHHTCSECNHVVNYEPCYHYCPYCGAEMEREVEE